jgi:hypothetical protein
MNRPRVAGEHGKGTLGCFVSLILLAAFSYAGYLIIPVYYHANEFHSSAEREVDRVAAKYLGDALLRKNLMNIAGANQIPLEEKNIQISRVSSQLKVNITYFVPVHFPMYDHTFRFELRLSSVMGAL